MSDPTLIKMLCGVITGLATAVIALWRLQVGREKERVRALEGKLSQSEHEAREWRSRWAEEIKRSSADAERFLRALEKRRTRSSGPPSR